MNLILFHQDLCLGILKQQNPLLCEKWFSSSDTHDGRILCAQKVYIKYEFRYLTKTYKGCLHLKQIIGIKTSLGH